MKYWTTHSFRRTLTKEQIGVKLFSSPLLLETHVNVSWGFGLLAWRMWNLLAGIHFPLQSLARGLVLQRQAWYEFLNSPSSFCNVNQAEGRTKTQRQVLFELPLKERANCHFYISFRAKTIKPTFHVELFICLGFEQVNPTMTFGGNLNKNWSELQEGNFQATFRIQR